MSMTESIDGLKRFRTAGSVNQVVDRLTTLMKSKNVTLFCVIDHSGEAQKVGIEMPDTKLLIFGNPASGTPLMLAAPSVAIDLPLKILVSEDSGGTVLISYNTPKYLMQRHGVPAEFLRNISAIDTLAKVVVEGSAEIKGSE